MNITYTEGLLGVGYGLQLATGWGRKSLNRSLKAIPRKLCEDRLAHHIIHGFTTVVDNLLKSNRNWEYSTVNSRMAKSNLLVAFLHILCEGNIIWKSFLNSHIITICNLHDEFREALEKQRDTAFLLQVPSQEL